MTAMIGGTTASGFAYEVSENAFDDMRLVDALADLIDNNDPIALSRITSLVLGKEQRAALYKHLQRDDGTVPAELVSKELVEIMQANAKNS